jgi:ATPase subunit of ABC transporter with duplicated ATPase domains
VQWLESHSGRLPRRVWPVTHDRYFLDNVAQWILELDRGQRHPYEGNYSTVPGDQASAPGGRGAQGREAGQDPAKELEWVRANPKARQAKNQARLKRYEELASEADRARKLDFEEINIPAGPRLGDVVLKANSCTRASAIASCSTG